MITTLSYELGVDGHDLSAGTGTKAQAHQIGANVRDVYALIRTAPDSETWRLVASAEKNGISRDSLMAFAMQDPADTAMIKRLDEAYFSTDIIGDHALQASSARKLEGEHFAEIGDAKVTRSDLHHLFATGELTPGLEKWVDAALKSGDKALAESASHILEGQARAAGERFTRNVPGHMNKSELHDWEKKFADIELRKEEAQKKAGHHVHPHASAQQESVRYVLAANFKEGTPADVLKRVHKELAGEGERIFAECTPSDIMLLESGGATLTGASVASSLVVGFKNGLEFDTIVPVIVLSPSSTDTFVGYLKTDRHLLDELRHYALDPDTPKDLADKSLALVKRAGGVINKGVKELSDHERTFREAFEKQSPTAMANAYKETPAKEREFLLDYAYKLLGNSDVGTEKLPEEMRYRMDARRQLAAHPDPEKLVAKFDRLSKAEHTQWEVEIGIAAQQNPKIALALFKSGKNEAMLKKLGLYDRLALDDLRTRFKEAIKHPADMRKIGADADHALGAKGEKIFVDEMVDGLLSRGMTYDAAKHFIDRMDASPKVKWEAQAALAVQAGGKEAGKLVGERYLSLLAEAARDKESALLANSLAERLRNDPALRDKVVAYAATIDSAPLVRMLLMAGYKKDAMSQGTDIDPLKISPPGHA